VAGKLASCAAMAMTFASYAAPRFQRPLAVAAVLVVTAVDYTASRRPPSPRGSSSPRCWRRSPSFVIAVWAGAQPMSRACGRSAAPPPTESSSRPGLLFFAFAGYAAWPRSARRWSGPERTIPRAIPIALAIALVVYAAVAVSALAGAGADAVAASPAPLADRGGGGPAGRAVPAVRAGAALASLGVLLSLIVGVSRTAFAMADNRDLPHFLAAVHGAPPGASPGELGGRRHRGGHLGRRRRALGDRLQLVRGADLLTRSPTRRPGRCPRPERRWPRALVGGRSGRDAWPWR